MGSTCGGCLVDIKEEDTTGAGRPSYRASIAYEDSVVLIVKLQARIRQFLARRRYLKLLANPDRFKELYPHIRKSRVSKPYQSSQV